MSQLDLLSYTRPAPRVAPSEVVPQRAEPVLLTHLLWHAAGRPTDTTGTDGQLDAAQVPGARCWWCGAMAPDGWVRPVSCIPDTFSDRHQAAVPESTWLCLPCGWVFCDRVALPAEIGAAKIRARAAKGGRLIVSVRGAPPARWLVREVDGRVELRHTGANADGDEAQWATPPVEVVDYADLRPEATEKFRSYHHLGHAGRWWPCTDADRQQIRAWLLAPPPPPWVCVIGDGKKHAALTAHRLDAVTTSDLAVVYLRGAVVTYEPAELAALVAAVEALIGAGANDDEITTGGYAPRDLALLRAIREHDPVVAPHRGGQTLTLALYLRRPRSELC